MQIQINTDHNIAGNEALAAHVRRVVEHGLSHLSDHITRVEVHLSDENGPTKEMQGGQNDKRCMMEARLENYHPLAVTSHAASVHQAVDGATEKLIRLVEGTLGRLHDHKHGRDTRMPGDDTPLDVQ